MTLRTIFRLAASAALAVSAALPAGAEDFYKGKSISIFIGSGAGGGFDTYGRTVAQYLGRHIPGNPNIVPVNRPGAGGRGNANLLFIRDPKDGTALGHLGPWLALEPLWGQKGVQFEPDKFNWLITMSQETSTCLWWAKSGVKTFQDLLAKKTATTGASGPTSSQASDAYVLNSVLKLNIKILLGFKGTRDVFLASERGEVDGACGLWWASVKSQYMEPINAGRANIILQLGNRRHPELDKRGVPFLGDIAKDVPQIDKDAMSIIFSMMDIARPFVAPPGVPADRVQLLRTAFMATATDPDFIAEATKRKLDLDPKSGDDVQKLVEAMYRHPKATVEHAKKMINP